MSPYLVHIVMPIDHSAHANSQSAILNNNLTLSEKKHCELRVFGFSDLSDKDYGSC